MSELTPIQIEARLRALITELTKAQRTLTDARDAEVEAKGNLRRARTTALLSGDCPKVARGGYTTAERDAWVEQQIEDAQHAYDVASAARENAQDYLRVVRDQAEIVRSLGASVRTAYEMAGVS